jgi:hypothetical protein
MPRRMSKTRRSRRRSKKRSFEEIVPVEVRLYNVNAAWKEMIARGVAEGV